MPDGDGFRARDLLGREAPGRRRWTGSPPRRLLDELGIGYLADRYVLHASRRHRAPGADRRGERPRRHVVADEFGAASAVGATLERFRLAFPAPDDLRPL